MRQGLEHLDYEVEGTGSVQRGEGFSGALEMHSNTCRILLEDWRGTFPESV